MKLLLISNMYPSSRYPSYGIFVKNHVKILKELGYEVKCITMTKVNNRIVKLLQYFWFYLKIIKNYCREKNSPVYVHFASHVSFIFLMLKIFFPNKKIIINVHGSDVIAQTNIQQILQRLFLQKFLTMALYIVVPSNYFKEVMIYKYRQPAERIVVSSSAGVDTKIFFPKKKNSQIISIGYVGRIDAKKRWDLAILAVKTLQQQQSNQEIRFVMVGDGKENEAKEHLITTSKLTEITECKKLLSQNKLATVYQSLDVLIFPSEQESLGLVGLEAMSCGIPVIGNDIPGISSYLIHGYNGFLFKRNNLESLVDQLKKFCCLTISEKELLAYNAFKTSQNYSKKVVKQEVKILLNQVFSNEI